ncbi:MAG TPA: hypothetical protein VF705_11290, partial [Longimicrobium sp.]
MSSSEIPLGGARLFDGRAADAAASARPAGSNALLEENWRRADRMLAWLLVGHLPLMIALAFLHGTWAAVAAW